MMQRVKEETTPTRVFVVDDHAMMRQVIAQLISREPALLACGQADSAEEALRLIPGARPDLVLVDLSLPGRNGLELVEELAGEWPDVTTLVLSGQDKRIFTERALQRGAGGYVEKGDINALLAAIHDLIPGASCGNEENGK